MPLNKSKGNMHGFVDYTWNTVKGKCPHDCSYCYMKRFPQKELHFDEKELKTDLGSGNKIFVGSSCDMWADKVPQLWIDKTLEYCWEYRNIYVFQSKNPMRIYKNIKQFTLENVCVGTTIESNIWYHTIMGGQPINQRVEAIRYIGNDYPVFITIEPIMQFFMDSLVSLIFNCQPKFVSIGADSGNNKLPEPSADKIMQLINELSKFTKVIQKDNLKRLLK